jgi:hypothetical protein
MKLIPYASQSYTSPLSKESLLQKLRQRITTKHSAVNHENIINHNVLAGEVRESSFTISGNRYGLTYGKTSLLPLLKGTLSGPLAGPTVLKTIIRPSIAGLAGIGLVYALLVFLFVHCAGKRDFTSCAFLVGFFAITYLSLMRGYYVYYAKYQRVMADIADGQA